MVDTIRDAEGVTNRGVSRHLVAAVRTAYAAAEAQLRQGLESGNPPMLKVLHGYTQAVLDIRAKSIGCDRFHSVDARAAR